MQVPLVALQAERFTSISTELRAPPDSHGLNFQLQLSSLTSSLERCCSLGRPTAAQREAVNLASIAVAAPQGAALPRHSAPPFFILINTENINTAKYPLTAARLCSSREGTGGGEETFQG